MISLANLNDLIEACNTLWRILNVLGVTKSVFYQSVGGLGPKSDALRLLVGRGGIWANSGLLFA